MGEQTKRVKLGLGTSATYCITIDGTLSDSWCEEMDDLHIDNRRGTGAEPQTTLTGPLHDQAALLGILNRLYGLGFPLRSVECLTTAVHHETCRE